MISARSDDVGYLMNDPLMIWNIRVLGDYIRNRKGFIAAQVCTPKSQAYRECIVSRHRRKFVLLKEVNWLERCIFHVKDFSLVNPVFPGIMKQYNI